MTNVIKPPDWDRLQLSRGFMEFDLARSGLIPEDMKAVPFCPPSAGAGGFGAQTVHVPTYIIGWHTRLGQPMPKMYRRRHYTAEDRRRFPIQTTVGVARDKYTQPSLDEIGSDARMPFFIPDRLRCPKGGDYYIVEGEKKCARLFKERPSWCVGIGGDWMWTSGAGSRELHPEIRADIEDCQPSRILIFADGDWTSYQINMAYSAAFAALRESFSDIQLMLADLSASGQKGVDDFLQAGGDLDDIPLRSADQIDTIEAPASLAKKYNLIPKIKAGPNGTQTVELVPNEDSIKKLMDGHPAFSSEHLWRNLDKDTEFWRGQPYRPEVDGFEIVAYFQRYLSMPTVTSAKVLAAVDSVAGKRPRSPLRELIQSVRWDGYPRLDSFFIDYAGVEDSMYARMVGSCYLLGAIKRLFFPGTKHDMMVILTGAQGIKKSTFWEALFGPENVNIIYGKPNSDRDFKKNINQRWCACLEEMNTYEKYDSEYLLAMITATDDVFREAYGKKEVEHPRKSVFVGNTNDDYFLKDGSQHRRFWPFRVMKLDISALTRDRDQIWAEAYERGIRNREQHWIDDALQFEELKIQFTIPNEYEDFLREILLKAVSSHRYGRSPILRGCDIREALILRLGGTRISDVKYSKAMKNLGWRNEVVAGTSMTPPVMVDDPRCPFRPGANRVWIKAATEPEKPGTKKRRKILERDPELKGR